MPITESQVLDALRHVIDPDLHRDIVTLGFIKDVSIDDDEVSFKVQLTTPACRCACLTGRRTRWSRSSARAC